MKKRWIAFLLMGMCVFNFLGSNGNLELVRVVAQSENSVSDLDQFEGIKYWEDEANYTEIHRDHKVSARAISKNSYSGRYGYEMLASDGQRELYDILEKAANEFHNSSNDVIVATTEKQDENGQTIVNTNYYAISVALTDKQVAAGDLGVVVVSMLYDHPEYFWSKGYSYFVNKETNLVTRVTLQCQADYYIGATRAAMRDQLQKEIEQYLDLIVGVKDDYEKELILHDAIANKITYAYSAEKEAETERWAHTIEGVFSPTYYSAVCEGYAKAFQLLLNAAGIENVYVVGTASGQGHAWNQAKIHGAWYNVDLTWDDTGNVKSRKYFNLPDSSFSTIHKPFLKTAVPKVGDWCYDVQKCNNTEYSFAKQGECKETEKFNVSYTFSGDVSVKMYNQGIEVASGSQVASGSALELQIMPTNTASCLSIDTNIGNRIEKYEGTLGSESLSYFFAADENKNIAVTSTICTNPPDATAIPKKDQASDDNQKGSQGQVATDGAILTTETPKNPVKRTLQFTTKKSKLKVGKSMTLKVKKNGTGTVTFTVSNKKRASIGKKNGRLKAKKAGAVWVTAKWKTCKVKKKIVVLK